MASAAEDPEVQVRLQMFLAALKTRTEHSATVADYGLQYEVRAWNDTRGGLFITSSSILPPGGRAFGPGTIILSGVKGPEFLTSE